MKKIEHFFSEAILHIFHPLLLPLVGLYYSLENHAFSSLLPFQYKQYLYIIMLISIYLIPMSSLPLLRNIGTISDYKLSNSRERVFPAMIVLVGLYFVYRTYSGFQIPMPASLRLFLLFILVAVLVVIFASFVYRLSLRALFFVMLMVFIASNAWITFINASWYIIILLLAYGIAVSQEIKTQRNTLKEVLLSSAIGLVISISLSILLS
jgi:hypothetical protein